MNSAEITAINNLNIKISLFIRIMRKIQKELDILKLQIKFCEHKSTVSKIFKLSFDKIQKSLENITIIPESNEEH